MKGTPGSRRRMAGGYWTFGALVAILAAEYFIGTTVTPAWPYMAGLAILGAALSMRFYMHINELGRSRGSHHE